MIKIDKRWSYRSLAEIDIIHMQCPVQQLANCIPKENRTPEEQELFEALMIVNKHISEVKINV